MIDVETRARRAGEAARVEADARARDLPRPDARAGRGPARRVGPRVAVGAVAGACAVVLLALLVWPGGPSGVPVIDPAAPDGTAIPQLTEVVDEPVAEDGVLPVPPVGEAIPAYLEDGTPVFVSHPADGEVHVLGARNPHEYGHRGKLVAWCPSSGWFEDLYHAAMFNAWGDYAGGPAPFALPDHAAELADDGRTVRVTGEVTATRPRTDRRSQQPPRGPNCPDGSDGASEVPPAVGHQIPGDLPLLDGTTIPTDRWVWAAIRTGGAPGDPRACDADGACPQSSPPLARIAGLDGEVTDGGTTGGLVRHTDEGVVVLWPGLPTWGGVAADEPVGPPGSEAEGARLGVAPRLLPLPEPGEVLAERYGPDQAPVFVARDDDGGVHVLDATSPSRGSSLVGWCPSSGAFVVDRLRWDAGGEGLGGGAWSDLGRYPAEIVTQDELSAVRVTGGREAEWSWTGEDLAGGANDGSTCATSQLVRHLPAEREPVAEHARFGGSGSEPVWRWVRMAIERVDGELLLCSVAGPQDCGEPGPEPDPTNADCYDDIGPDGLCPPEVDPVVVTADVRPTDGPVLLLVRPSGDGRTVEVRHPAEVGGP
jgi:hypothetical protein